MASRYVSICYIQKLIDVNICKRLDLHGKVILHAIAIIQIISPIIPICFLLSWKIKTKAHVKMHNALVQFYCGDLVTTNQS